jgi:hypothetical protein
MESCAEQRRIQLINRNSVLQREVVYRPVAEFQQAFSVVFQLANRVILK